MNVSCRPKCVSAIISKHMSLFSEIPPPWKRRNDLLIIKQQYFMKKLMVLPSLVAAVAIGLLQGCSESPGNGDVSEIVIRRLSSDDSSSVRVMFIPSSNTEWFDYGIGKDRDLSSFLDGSLPGMERAEGNDTLEITFNGLEPSEEYTVFAQGMSSSGLTGGVSLLGASTPDNRITATLGYVTSNSCGFRIEFTTDYYECIYYLGKPEDKQAFLAGELENGRLTEVDGYGCVNYFEGIEPGSELVFYAIGHDRYGMESRLFEIPVSIPEEGSNKVPDVEFVLESIDIYKGTYRFIPNAACGKIACSIGEIGDVSGMLSSSTVKGDIALLLDSWALIPEETNSHIAEGEELVFDNYTEDMATGTVLELYVLTYDKEGNPAGAKAYTVSTPETDESLPEANITSIKLENITKAGATYTITPDENTFAIMYDTYDAGYYDQITSSSDWHEYFIHSELMTSGNGKFHYGSDPVIYSEVQGEPYTEYLLCVSPMNGNGPTEAGWGPLAVSKRYRTLSE